MADDSYSIDSYSNLGLSARTETIANCLEKLFSLNGNNSNSKLVNLKSQSGKDKYYKNHVKKSSYDANLKVI